MGKEIIIIIIIIIIILLASSSQQRYLTVFHWSLSDSKSSGLFLTI